MNLLAQFLHYAQKVFGLKGVARGIRDGRPYPKIPTLPVFLSLLLGVVLRIGSYVNLSEQTKRRRWRHLTGLKGPISDDTFDYVTERLWAEDLRQAEASVVKKLKANKALESCKINGLLFLSLDANEHCKSRSRCCACCCQREIEETDAQGQKRTVIEYYHGLTPACSPSRLAFSINSGIFCRRSSEEERIRNSQGLKRSSTTKKL